MAKSELPRDRAGQSQGVSDQSRLLRDSGGYSEGRREKTGEPGTEQGSRREVGAKNRVA